MPIPEVIREAIAARTPRQATIGAGRPWYGSVDPLSEYGGAVEEAYNPLEDFIPQSVLRRFAAQAIWPMALGRIGVLPGRERIASDIIKRGLKEPWFHGTPRANAVLTGQGVDPKLVGGWLQIPGAPSYGQGFRMDPLGQTSGLRLGEPAGVSLTRSPEVARKFGDVLRVGVDIPPSSVGQFVDPEFQRLLRASYRSAGYTPTAVAVAKRPLPPATQVMSGPSDIAHFSTPAYKEAGWQIQPGKTFQDMFSQGVSPEALPQWAIPDFNRAMSEYLRGAGVEAIAYNPRRWAEYEMRVLDPSKAVPLGRLDVGQAASVIGTPGPKGSIGSVQINPAVPGSDVMQRYLYGSRPLTSWRQSQGELGSGLLDRLRQQYLTAPEFPVRLRDVLGIAGAD